MQWKPPKSPYNLLQEQVWHNPWKIFVCCIFCNLTRRVDAEPYFWKFLRIYPTPQCVAAATVDEIADMIHNLGLSNRRAKALREMSIGYIKGGWEDDPKKLYGIGKYGSDAYHIFCKGTWRDVHPKDHALNDYHEYLKCVFN